MKPRRLQSATIFSIVATSVAMGGNPRPFRKLVAELAGTGVSRRQMTGYGADLPMVIFRPIGHLAAWLVWHSTGKSLLQDLDAPDPPAAQ